jgi:CheY-like chemotaxis protein
MLQRVLVLDDDGERIVAFTRALSKPGVNFGVARTAQDAMHMLKTQHWDIVFLDHDLGLTPTKDPGDGTQVVKFIVKLARHGRFRKTKFYIHSINMPRNQWMTQTLVDAGLRVRSAPFVWERIR